jgi:orotidine-5'-phosphate decarboxylase
LSDKTLSPWGQPPKRIIVALDVPDADAALALASRLDPRLCRVKIGKELFVAAGPAVVARIQERGFEVFLDLKFHDIPNTVAGACRSAARLGVWMMNVHASGGEAMMRAARDAVAGATKPPLLIAVTVLTSLADIDLKRLGRSQTVAQEVEQLARLARDCGLDGVVCSAQEAVSLRKAIAAPFALVTPGIRLESDSGNDQARVVTPVDAVRRGADYLVIGRSITHAKDPVATLNTINESLATGAPA